MINHRLNERTLDECAKHRLNEYYLRIIVRAPKEEYDDKSCRLNKQIPDESAKCRLNGYHLKIIV